MDETVDVINNNGKFINKEEKRKCHKEGLRHRTVGIFIFNDKGELLLQKRAMNMEIFPGRYECSASGHIGTGETSEEGARKELKEELGIETNLKLIVKDLIEDFDEKSNKIRHFISFFIGSHNGPFNIQESELDSIEFFSIDEIKIRISQNPQDFTKAFKMFFKIYVEKK